MASTRKKKTTTKRPSQGTGTARKRSKKTSAKGRTGGSRRKKDEEADAPATTEDGPRAESAESAADALLDQDGRGDGGDQDQDQDQDLDLDSTTSLYELHGLIEQLGQTVRQQWRELQEATRSLDELRSHSPRRSDVMEGRTYLSQDMRAIVEPLQDETERLNRRLQWCFGLLMAMTLVAVPALLKVLLG